MVLDEGQLNTARILEFLHAHGVTHVATYAIELVGQDVPDLLLSGIRSDPLDHLIEGRSFRSAFGRLGHDELTHDRPAFLLGLLPRGAQLCVDGVPFMLLDARLSDKQFTLRGQSAKHRDAERIAEAIGRIPGLSARAPRTTRLKSGGVEFSIIAKGADANDR